MRLSLAVFGALAAASHAAAYTVAIKDTDDYREVCNGMYGGDKAYIEVAFDSGSDGQVALVIYEWTDVDYLGVATPGTEEDAFGYRPKTYICTSSAVTSGLCKTAELGSFIVNTPEGVNATSVYTTPLRFDGSSSSGDSATTTTSADIVEATGSTDTAAVDEGDDFAEGSPRRKRAGAPALADSESADEDDPESDATDSSLDEPDFTEAEDVDGTTHAAAAALDEEPTTTTDAAENEADVPLYSAPIHYNVPHTGYYCVGVVPVTLRSQRSEIPTVIERTLEVRDSAVHAAYSGAVTFKNQFTGELSAAEYPKIMFYAVLSVVYILLAAGWAFLCYRHFRELLPTQYYISGTILFLNVEMLALFAYYRYINKHGGGAGSLAFLIVISILNAARNSLSFFLLLIVCMGLSVVTPSLGAVMNRVRLLTGFHFIFGVMYAVGTVKLDIDTASLFLVLGIIFPLAMTLTAFLMWIIISLNGTILHLQQRKQNFKLQMFQRLWRILIMSVIAVGGFFVLSSISLSNRLDEDYAPNNWRFRWVLLDASLALIYLSAFTAISWLWRPTENNVRFAMSQELAQDEADAEDYEIHSLEQPREPLGLEPEDGRIRLHGDDDSDDDDGPNKGRFQGGQVHDDNVVFSMGDDSDDEEAAAPAAPNTASRRSSRSDGSRSSGEGRRLLASGKKSD